MKSDTGFIDFVKTFLNNQKVSNTAKDYQSWLKLNGIDSGRIYGEGIRAAESDYQRARAEYGSNAERLHELGLSGSGYSDYISAAAFGAAQKKKSDALDAYAENERKNMGSYYDYLTKQQSDATSLYKSVSADIISNRMINYDDAYKHAIGRGMDEESAAALAKQASEIAKKQLREEVGRTVINQNLTPSQAERYALYLGFSEEEAKEISDFAKNQQSYLIHPDGQSYLDYLKDKLNNE